MTEFILGFATTLIAYIVYMIVKRMPRKRKLYSFEPDYVVRPSQDILEAMEFVGINTISIWAKTRFQWSTIAKLLADEIQIDEPIATELSNVLGSSPEFWMALSKNYFEKKGGSDAHA